MMHASRLFSQGVVGETYVDPQWLGAETANRAISHIRFTFTIEFLDLIHVSIAVFKHE